MYLDAWSNTSDQNGFGLVPGCCTRLEERLPADLRPVERQGAGVASSDRMRPRPFDHVFGVGCGGGEVHGHPVGRHLIAALDGRVQVACDDRGCPAEVVGDVGGDRLRDTDSLRFRSWRRASPSRPIRRRRGGAGRVTTLERPGRSPPGYRRGRTGPSHTPRSCPGRGRGRGR